MKNIWLRRVLIMLLMMVLLTVPGFASEPIYGETISEVNALYADIPVSAGEQAPVMAASGGGSGEYVTTEDAVVDALRSGMIQRNSTITILYATQKTYTAQEFKTLFYRAYEECDDPRGGDYLHWSWQTMSVGYSGYVQSGTNYYTLTYTVSYYSNAAQEAELTAKIDSVLAGFGFTNATSDYVKVKTIYDYICANVVYDHESFAVLFDAIQGNETADDYLCLTAYSALVRGEAVCQGYATLFYRMAETCGVDARLIAGSSRGGNHAWNIAKLGKVYFNLDSTWDAGKDSKLYFLQSEAAFASDHQRWSDYTSTAFVSAYPMGDEYIPNGCDTSGHVFTSTVTAPSCIAQGYTTHSCACGKSYQDTYTDKIPHAWDSGVITREPTETEYGITIFTCSGCGGTKEENIDKLYNPFVDISDTADAWYYRPVLWAVEGGITNGMDSTHFGPESPCTRAHVVTFLWRAAGAPEPDSSRMPFVDVAAGEYYYKAVLWAAEQGITTGVDATHFAPEQSCTRAQVVTFLWRMDGEKAPTGSASGFSDTPKHEYFYNSVLWAVDQGITNGMGDGTFGASLTCTRAHVVTFLYRYYH